MIIKTSEQISDNEWMNELTWIVEWKSKFIEKPMLASEQHWTWKGNRRAAKSTAPAVNDDDIINNPTNRDRGHFSTQVYQHSSFP